MSVSSSGPRAILDHSRSIERAGGRAMQLGMIGLGRMGADKLLARDGRAWRLIEEERLSSEASEVPAATGKATAHVL